MADGASCSLTRRREAGRVIGIGPGGVGLKPFPREAKMEPSDYIEVFSNQK